MNKRSAVQSMTYRQLASLFMAPFGLTVLGCRVPASSHPCRFQVHPPCPPTPSSPAFPFCKISESSAAGARPESKTSTARHGVKQNGSSQLGDQRASLAVHSGHCFLMFFRRPFAAENASNVSGSSLFSCTRLKSALV